MENIYNDVLDIYFKENLLKNVQFLFNNKLLEEGKLISYKQDIYNVCFVLNTKKEDHDEFYLPIPFNINCNNNLISFDYRLKTFCKNNTELYYLINDVIKKYDPSNYFDKIVDIKLI